MRNTEILYNYFLEKNNIEDEIEYHRAEFLDRRLRLLSFQNPEYKNYRKVIQKLMEIYYDKHWSDFDKITDEQVRLSDEAEKIVNKEFGIDE